jgi:hypothetical protein
MTRPGGGGGARHLSGTGLTPAHATHTRLRPPPSPPPGAPPSPAPRRRPRTQPPGGWLQTCGGKRCHRQPAPPGCASPGSRKTSALTRKDSREGYKTQGSLRRAGLTANGAHSLPPPPAAKQGCPRDASGCVRTVGSTSSSSSSVFFSADTGAAAALAALGIGGGGRGDRSARGRLGGGVNHNTRPGWRGSPSQQPWQRPPSPFQQP